MNGEVTQLQFWLAILTLAIPDIIKLIGKWREIRANQPVVEGQKEVSVSEAWERLANGYQRQIESLNALQEENRQLRPLVLKLALQDQEMQQIKEDKEDWKRYAQRLANQLEEHQLVPLPFRRTPSDGDTGQMKTGTVPRKTESVEEITQTLTPIDKEIIE